MSESEVLTRYVESARASGARVEFVTMKDLPVRLAELLAESFRTVRREAVERVAAVPASDWPRELLEVVKSALAGSGFEVVSPEQTPEGYTWDRRRLAEATVGITFCTAYLAETGSLAVPSGPGAGTLATLLPEVHIALSYPDGCRGGLADYLNETAGAFPARLALVTGPSRTGDIEATMTTGVHGPGKVVHIILTDRE